LKAVIESLPKARQRKIDLRFRALKGEVESLAALRKVAGKAQTEIASVLKITQPSISKLERQSDMYLSTLSHYVKAIGGDLELVVRLPSKASLRLRGLGELLPRGDKPKVRAPRSVKKRATA
jgi:transcriptional regulator with XRE-family HTH domain